MGIGSAIGGIAGGVLSSSASGKAAKAQERAAQAQLQLAREQFDRTEENLTPFREAGTNALSAFLFELGLGPAPTFGGSPAEIEEFTDTVPGQGFGAVIAEGGRREGETVFREQGPTERTRFRVGDQVFDSRDAAQEFAEANPVGATTFNGIQASPAALFALEQGRDTIEAGAAARGGLNSGATLAGLERLRFGLSAQDRDNQLNRLAGLIDSGQGAAGQQAVASNAFVGQASNALGNIGNAQSAGIIGQNNAFQNALSNLTGSAGFLSGQGTGNSFGNLFSLFSGAAPGSANSLGL
jgi:hypothetical protein